MLKYILLPVSILILVTSLSAQPVIPGADVQVSENRTSAVQPYLALDGDGTLAIHWENYFQMFDSGLNPIDSNRTLNRVASHPFFTPDGHLAYMGAVSSGNQGYNTEDETYYYKLIDTTETIISDILYHGRYRSFMYPPGYESTRSPVIIQRAGSGVRNILGMTLYSVYREDSFSSEFYESKLLNYEIDLGTVTTLDSVGRRWQVGQGDRPVTRGTPLQYLSPAYDNSFIAYRRLLFDDDSGSLDATFRFYDGDGSPVSNNVPLYRLSAEQSMRFEQPLLNRSTVSILYRHRFSDQLMCDIFSRDGQSIRTKKPLGISTDSTNSHQFMQRYALDATANFLAANLPGDRYMVLWSQRETDDDINLYVQVFDENFDPVSNAKRVNTITEGLQVFPDVLVSNDTIYVAWASQETGRYGHIYTKRFTINDVVSVVPTPVVQGFNITSLYPQPAQERLSITYSSTANSSHAELIIYNLLGKEVLRQSATSGRATASLQGIPSGVYRAVLKDGQRQSSRLFVVSK